MLHVVVVDVVSLQQAAVAGTLHGELRGRKQTTTTTKSLDNLV